MELKQILEAAMMAAARPLGFQEFANLFDETERPTQEQIEQVLAEIQNDFEHRPLELKRVASGYRFQVRESFSPWVSRLFEERPGRYSRAFLETLAIIAYRQPATRGEIEDIRGVAVSSNIIKTMLERDWIHIVGHKDVPGRPALFATTRHFLDYFNLTSLSEMPPLQAFIDALDVTSSEAITDSNPQPVIAETHTKNNEIEHADSE
ncbi:MAG: SMC-Scp complex subunit ScpB [Methylococcaceae bacterium]|nr:SMC-Scp complex subunit ScpB [Methylococcaceae bacterium]